MVHIGNRWDELLAEEFKKDYYLKLREKLIQEYRTKTIYPPMGKIFESLVLTDYDDVSVVILGQDPYFNPGQANGLAFSVNDGTKLPPSLQNIYKELESDLGIPRAQTGDLTKWAKEGVLLLNASLTVRGGEPNSHQALGWSFLTDKIVELLNEREEPMVFILWGNFAIKKARVIDETKHLVLRSVHPSPLSASRGFFGSKPFSKANTFLESVGRQKIDWRLE
ncbi:uracil-DNA glycosylase [Guggenheimella bovis]